MLVHVRQGEGYPLNEVDLNALRKQRRLPSWPPHYKVIDEKYCLARVFCTHLAQHPVDHYCALVEEKRHLEGVYQVTGQRLPSRYPDAKPHALPVAVFRDDNEEAVWEEVCWRLA
jgi:hypothetical protein